MASYKIIEDITWRLRATAGLVSWKVWVLRISVSFHLFLGFCPKEIIRKSVEVYLCDIIH